MTAAVRPLTTGQESRAQVTQGEAVRRAARPIGFLAVILQPIVTVTAIGAGIALLRQRRLKARIYLPVALGVLLVVVLLGGVRLYLAPWRAIAVAVAHAIEAGERGPANLASVAMAQLSENWLHFLLIQLPLGLALGATIGASWAAYRSRRLAPWRRPEVGTEPVDDKKLRTAMAALPEWPEQPKPDRRSAARPIGDKRVRLGCNTLGSPAPYSLTVKELGSHAYVDGPTGFGKTTFLLEVAAGVVENPDMAEHRCPLLYITMKPDPDTTQALAGIAKAAGRRFWHVTHDGREGDNYNPLHYGDANQIAAAIIEAEAHAAAGGFTEPHHRRAGERYLRYAARALVELHAIDAGKWPKTYATLKRLLYIKNVSREAAAFSPTLASEWDTYVKEIGEDKDLLRSLAGLRQRIADAAEGGARHVLSGGGLILQDAIDDGSVIVFDLDADEDANAAQLVGNLVLADASASLARLGKVGWHYQRNTLGEVVRGADNKPVQTRYIPIIVDEFSALGGTQLAGMFRRVRSRGGGVILATQEGGSLDLAGPGFAEMVVTNANIAVFFAQEVNAERYANLFGTRKTQVETQQLFEEASLVAENVYASGQGNLREAHTYVLSPDELRQLRPGEVWIRVRHRAGERPARVAVQRTVEIRHSRSAAADAPTATAPNPYLAIAAGHQPTTSEPIPSRPRPVHQVIPRALTRRADRPRPVQRVEPAPESAPVSAQARGTEQPELPVEPSGLAAEGWLWSDDEVDAAEWPDAR